MAGVGRLNFGYGLVLGVTVALFLIAALSNRTDEFERYFKQTYSAPGQPVVNPRLGMQPAVTSDIANDRLLNNLSNSTAITSLAREISSSVKLLCFVLTYPANLQKKAVHVRDTWAKRCDKTLFISDTEDKSFPTIAVGNSGYKNLWSKTRATFLMLADTYLEEYDWFLKADDDTYVIVENLKALVYSYSPTEPTFFGKRFRTLVKQGYMSGGAGYAMNKGALAKLAEGLRKENDACPGPSSKQPEDMLIGKCLEWMGVRPGESLDSEGKERFHPFDFGTEMKTNLPAWYYKYSYHQPRSGLNCCSNYTISFHYVSPDHMHLLELAVYHLRPFGGVQDAMQLAGRADTAASSLLPPDAFINRVCEGESFGMTCGLPGESIQVVSASWGHPMHDTACAHDKDQHTIVSQFNHTCITNPQAAADKLKEKCDRQEVCNIKPTREQFGVPECPEPFPDKLKIQLRLEYRCHK